MTTSAYRDQVNATITMLAEASRRRSSSTRSAANR
jgi:hypothetical protein